MLRVFSDSILALLVFVPYSNAAIITHTVNVDKWGNNRVLFDGPGRAMVEGVLVDDGPRPPRFISNRNGFMDFDLSNVPTPGANLDFVSATLRLTLASSTFPQTEFYDVSFLFDLHSYGATEVLSDFANRQLHSSHTSTLTGTPGTTRPIEDSNPGLADLRALDATSVVQSMFDGTLLAGGSTASHVGFEFQATDVRLSGIGAAYPRLPLVMSHGYATADGAGGGGPLAELVLEFRAVPEPATIAVWSLIGLCGVGCGVRRRMKKAA